MTPRLKLFKSSPIAKLKPQNAMPINLITRQLIEIKKSLVFSMSKKNQILLGEFPE